MCEGPKQAGGGRRGVGEQHEVRCSAESWSRVSPGDESGTAGLAGAVGALRGKELLPEAVRGIADAHRQPVALCWQAVPGSAFHSPPCLPVGVPFTMWGGPHTPGCTTALLRQPQQPQPAALSLGKVPGLGPGVPEPSRPPPVCTAPGRLCCWFSFSAALYP